MGRFTFSKGGFTTWAPSRGRSFPKSTPIKGYDVIEQTEDGTFQVSNYGAVRIHPVTISRLPRADWDGGFDWATKTQTPGTQSLANWFYNVAGRMLNTFTFNDEEGVPHTVRFSEPELSPTDEDNRYVDVSFELIEEL